MDAQQIKAFIDAMAASDLQEMEVSHGGWTLRLARGAAAGRAGTPSGAAAAMGGFGGTAAGSEACAAPHATAAVQPGAGTPAAPATADILSPLFGVVHLCKAPGEPPHVQVGDAVVAGQVLCTIEAMKVFNEVCAESPGRVVAVLVASGAEVEAGHPLLRIERDGHV